MTWIVCKYKSRFGIFTAQCKVLVQNMNSNRKKEYIELTDVKSTLRICFEMFAYVWFETIVYINR